MLKKDFYVGYDSFFIERPFDFSSHSSIGCGGYAKIGFYPRSAEELRLLLSRLESEGREYIPLGNLTNVLPSDLGTQKAVVSTKKLAKITVCKEENRVYAEAGVTSGTLLQVLKALKLSGAEFLTGIPCTLGGALYMNAGAGGKYISELVESVCVYRAGELITLPLSECGYAYKESAFMHTGDTIVGATLRMEKSTAEEIAQNQKAWGSRRAHLPKGKSMGCVFKNPPNVSAGELIEKTGLKGMRVGGAVVSPKHANFIINDKKARSSEIQNLILLIKNAVFAQYGVELQEEIQYLE